MKKHSFEFKSLSDSKAVSKVLSNNTARSILKKISEEPASATKLSEELKKPLTTIDYNLKNLKEAGLVKLSKRAISKKGRLVDVWEPEKKLILISPILSKEKVLDILKSSSAYVVISGIIAVFLEWFSYSQVNGIELMTTKDIMYSLESSTSNSISMSNPHYGILFFVISLIVIFLFFTFRKKATK